jgi:hypothetical protein
MWRLGELARRATALSGRKHRPANVSGTVRTSLVKRNYAHTVSGGHNCTLWCLTEEARVHCVCASLLLRSALRVRSHRDTHWHADLRRAWRAQSTLARCATRRRSCPRQPRRLCLLPRRRRVRGGQTCALRAPRRTPTRRPSPFRRCPRWRVCRARSGTATAFRGGCALHLLNQPLRRSRLRASPNPRLGTREARAACRRTHTRR